MGQPSLVDSWPSLVSSFRYTWTSAGTSLSAIASVISEVGTSHESNSALDFDVANSNEKSNILNTALSAGSSGACSG